MSWKALLFVLVLLAAIGGSVGFFYPFNKQPEELKFPGVIEIQEVRLGSKISGRVAEVRVREGDIVNPGQLLVRFDAPELEAQLKQLEGRLASAEAELTKAKNGPRREEIQQAKSDLASNEADLKLANEEFERSDRLFRLGSESRSDYDTARATRSRFQGRVALSKAKLDLLLAGTRQEDIDIAQANVVEIRGRVQEIKANLAETRVLAPERALVEVVAVRKGDLVPANQPVIRVLRAEDLWVRVYVPETQLGKIRLEQHASVTMDAYPDKRFAGTVFQIASESEFTPRNVQSVEERRYQVFGVKVRIDDPQGVFKSGMAAEVMFDTPPAPEKTGK
jgi:multidrug resistance efflux pump